MLFIAVTMVLCGPGVKDPSEFWPRRSAARTPAAADSSTPTIFSFWDRSSQTESNRFYTASALRWECISDKPGIAHRLPRLDNGSVKFTAGIGEGGIAAHTIDLQRKPVV